MPGGDEREIEAVARLIRDELLPYAVKHSTATRIAGLILPRVRGVRDDNGYEFVCDCGRTFLTEADAVGHMTHTGEGPGGYSTCSGSLRVRDDNEGCGCNELLGGHRDDCPQWGDSPLADFQENLTRALNEHGVPAMPSWQAAIDWLAEHGGRSPQGEDHEPCPDCWEGRPKWAGTMPAPPCPTCGGTGKVRPQDEDHEAGRLCDDDELVQRAARALARCSPPELDLPWDDLPTADRAPYEDAAIAVLMELGSALSRCPSPGSRRSGADER